MSAPLPAFWSEEMDDRGRTYYSNHRTRETAWQRPAAHAATPEAPVLPPPYDSNAYAPHQPASGPSPYGPCCTPRQTFWLSCALGWIVWILAIAVSVDDAWISGGFFRFAALYSRVFCIDSTGVCDLYTAFLVVESFAILLVSIAMLMQMIALFRPASGRCCSVKALALAGGIIMAAYAFLQMVAFVLVIVMEKEYDDGWYSSSSANFGRTFGVAVVAFLLGMVQATFVLTFARSAGNGPAYNCCSECKEMKEDPYYKADKEGGGVYSHQPQPTMQQQAPRTDTGPAQLVPVGAGKPAEPASVAV